MDDYEFFEDEADDDGLLDRAAVEAIRRGTSSIPDLEAAERLVDQVAALMVSVSTGGPRIEDVQASYKREYRALAAVLKRLGIRDPKPMDDLWRWHGRWSDGTLPTYASRRAFVAEMYAPVRDALEAKVDTLRHVATGTGDALTGWAEVDSKISTLQRRMSEAETADDFKAVGLQCVAVLEALGRAAFVPSWHLPTGEAEPHPNDARNRLGFFLRAVATGDRFEEVRPIIRATWRQAQAVKHRDSPNRTDAGVSADATALLVAIIRRLADEDEHYHELAEAHFARDDDVPFYVLSGDVWLGDASGARLRPLGLAHFRPESSGLDLRSRCSSEGRETVRLRLDKGHDRLGTNTVELHRLRRLVGLQSRLEGGEVWDLEDQPDPV